MFRCLVGQIIREEGRGEKRRGESTWLNTWEPVPVIRAYGASGDGRWSM